MATLTKKAHLVFVPCPGISHLVSPLEFAKHLITRDHRLSITIFVISSPLDTKTTAAYTQSLASSDRIHLLHLSQPPSPVPSNDSDSQIGSTIKNLIESQKPHVKEAVANLTPSHAIAAFVVDMFCTTMIDIARDLGVPSFVFSTSGAAFIGLMLHLHTLRERDNLDTTELEGSDTELAIPCFANPVPARVLPTVALRKEWEPFYLPFMSGLKKADGFIVNSFEELESHAVRAFSDGGVPVYPVGPILKVDDSGDASAEIIRWLDDQPPLSVVFLCFGSMGWFGEDHAREIAHALEDSGARFIWSMRKAPPDGSFGMPTEYSPHELDAILPQGFLDRTARIGRVIGWAPQAQVLAHKATGGFVSHCGWNSILESINFGVPIATWPLRAEQQINAFELVCELKMAVEISLDYRMDFRAGSETVVSADKIERGIRSVLEMDGAVRKRVKEMSDKSRSTMREGGCSHSHLGRFIDYIMNRL